MKYCIYCGKQLPDNAHFCSRCGKAVEQTIVDEDDKITRVIDSTGSEAPINTTRTPVAKTSETSRATTGAAPKKHTANNLSKNKVEINSNTDKIVCTIALAFVLISILIICWLLNSLTEGHHSAPEYDYAPDSAPNYMQPPSRYSDTLPREDYSYRNRTF